MNKLVLILLSLLASASNYAAILRAQEDFSILRNGTTVTPTCLQAGMETNTDYLYPEMNIRPECGNSSESSDLLSGSAPEGSPAATSQTSGYPVHDSLENEIKDLQLPPVTKDDYDTTLINTNILLTPLINDWDPYGNPVRLINVRKPLHGIMEVKEDRKTILYSPNQGYTGDDYFAYVIIDTVNLVRSDTAVIHIYVSAGIPMIVHNIITPNGDGFNDRWIIEGIEEFQNNSITIFNRWGDEINSFEGYDNASRVWNGTNVRNERVPDGTYFYILKIRNVGDYTGWIYVRGNS
jgi:gliding motility-associated-like protein